MKVRIVCYEDVDAWILGKFAKKLSEELNKLGVSADIAKTPNPEADINHHIIYWDYDGNQSSVDTVMITHIDTIPKVLQLKRQLKVAEMGICMSSSTVKQLQMAGLPLDRLCYILPAHDGVIVPKKIIVGITCKVHYDGRKREKLLVQLLDHINCDEFAFRIMGEGWESIVSAMSSAGFSVEYFPEFNYEQYCSLIPSLDYYLYTGKDEGQMGFIDALAAGVPTIVTPQGYHLDAPGGIAYPFETLHDLVRIFNEIADKKRVLRNAVRTWTWADYAKKHKLIWEYLLLHRDKEHFQQNVGKYPDGLASLISSRNQPTQMERIQSTLSLCRSTIYIYYHWKLNSLKKYLNRVNVPYV